MFLKQLRNLWYMLVEWIMHFVQNFCHFSMSVYLDLISISCQYILLVLCDLISCLHWKALEVFCKNRCLSLQLYGWLLLYILLLVGTLYSLWQLLIGNWPTHNIICCSGSSFSRIAFFFEKPWGMTCFGEWKVWNMEWKVRNKLDKIYEQKSDGIRIRSKCDWYEHGEKPSKFFLNLFFFLF